MSNAAYIAIEGIDSPVKDDLLRLLGAQLQAQAIPVRIVDSPSDANSLTARTIRQLIDDPTIPMNSRTEVLLYNAARSESLDTVRAMTDAGVTCLTGHSYLSALVTDYYGRGIVKDYQRVTDIVNFATGEIQPDLIIVLDIPVDAGSFEERVRAGYLWEAKQRGLPVVEVADDVSAAFSQAWQHVAGILQVRDGKVGSQPQSVAEVLASNPPVKTEVANQESPQQWVKKHKNGAMSVTDAGKAELAKYVTNTDSNVYSFTKAMSHITIAAAMARLSRRGDDMRVTLLDEFIGKQDKDEQLLKRVITAYGDDSVQQLVGHHVVVEGASNLIVKKLEWGRLAAYLEQSTRYIYFDQKDAHGRYRYYIPAELKGKIRSQYIKTMNQIFDLYSKMAKEMTDYVRKNSTIPASEQDAAWRMATKAQACDAIRGVLPVAYTGTVGIYGSGQALESLIMHLLADELPEARTVGKQLLEELRKVMPAFLERADKPDRGGATIAYRANTTAQVKQLAEELLPPNHAAQSEPVQLVSHNVANELDIVADMLYEYSDLPLEDLKKEVANWPYERKQAVFTAYMGERLNRRQRPGRALEKIHYSFDLVSEYGVFKDLQRHRMVDDLGWQLLSPRLGYEVPQLVEDAGQTDAFLDCFDLSLQLYSALQASHGSLVAQYAVLQGHRLRWKVTLNAREAFQMFELRSTPQGHPAYRKLVQQMHDKVAEVHPMLAEAMIFMNKDEDPELSRLAAEKYTQYKLAKLDDAATEKKPTARGVDAKNDKA